MPRIYCNETCRDSYHTDQRYGAMGYAAVAILKPDAPVEGPIDRERDILEYVSWSTYARRARVCRYCRKPLPEPGAVPQQIPGQLALPPNPAAISAVC
jgi:hypothetical protein